MSPMLVSSIFILAVVVFCFLKPNAGRIFLGFFFLAMALGVNGSFTFSNPQAYIDYANGALIPLYRTITVSVISVSPFLFGILLMAFEIAMGLLLLHKQKSVKLGLLGTMLFLAGMAPLDWVQLPWLGLIISEIYLFRQDFDRSFLEMVWPKPKKGVTNA
jgi:hypothetical protein